MNWYWLQILFYAFLVAHFCWYKPQLPDPVLWNPIDTSLGKISTTKECKTHSDCTDVELCFHNQCVPTLSRDGNCNPTTGDWTVVRDEAGNAFLQCVCKYPNLITQKNAAGDCDVDVACGPHGNLVDWTKRDSCVCDSGYAPGGQLTCRKMFAFERQFLCDPDTEIEDAPKPYSQAYRDENREVRCHRRPCTFDVLTGRTLEGTSYDPYFGCVCDPRRGQFGVRFAQDSVLESGHYHGCASIFRSEPPTLQNASVYVYYYVHDKPPIAFVQWPDLDESFDLNPVFSRFGKKNLQIGQHWEFNFAMWILQRRREYTVRSRSVMFRLRPRNESKYVEDKRVEPPIRCKDLPSRMDPLTRIPYSNTYQLLYQFPVCHIESDDLTVHEQYRGRYVLNPFMLRWEHHAHLPRSNGIVLKPLKLYDPTDDNWLLDLAPPYQFDTFFKGPSESVPNFENLVSKDVPT